MNNLPRRRVLSVFSLVMINVIAVDSLRTLPISAEYGFSLIFYYVLAALIFFIPIALVAAELATGWPQTGGVYVWVREAFGKRVGFLIIWLQWIYNVVWYPTILVFIAGTLAYLINPNLAENKHYLVAVILVTFWTATIVNCLGMRVSSWISTIGALLGTIVPMVFIIILSAVWLGLGKPMAIDFSWHTALPHLKSLNQLALFIGILFGLVGMEMSASHAEEVKNPQRDYPRALLYSTIIIFASLVFASLAIAIVVPQKQLSLVTGLIEAFTIFFNTFHMHWMIPVMSILIIIGGIAGVAAWIIGPTKGLLMASRDGSMPAIFSKVNKHGAPVAILLLQAIIFTLLSLVFLYMPTVNSSYWLLTAMTAQLALMVYVGMFAAAIKLRYSQADVTRTYTIPGGKIGVWIVAGFGLLTCLVAIAVGFLPPSQFKIGNVEDYEMLLTAGIVIFCVLPILIRQCFRKPNEEQRDHVL